ncbi:NUDIX domain-containing protein [Puniceibacterium confluentis]|uniref:NUDIX domain-containing protein n=1 Tax=Puniceibacterium confluentis TaxID=1958944 RepID=UPI001FE96E46|nr:NUDIX hydrolase [Puniceibacterium confluentis]
MQQDAFIGAKVMLFVGDRLLVIRRDHTPGIPFPGFLDFPGGGREGAETPEDCVLREAEEEIGLRLNRHQLVWRQPYDSAEGQRSWFFAAHVAIAAAGQVRFGDEGVGWTLILPPDYLGRADAIPHFQWMLRQYLASKGNDNSRLADSDLKKGP